MKSRKSGERPLLASPPAGLLIDRPFLSLELPCGAARRKRSRTPASTPAQPKPAAVPSNALVAGRYPRHASGPDGRSTSGAAAPRAPRALKPRQTHRESQRPPHGAAAELRGESAERERQR